MKDYGAFLYNLRSSSRISLDQLAPLVQTSKSTLSRLENNNVARPFKGSIRELVLALAQVLCTSSGDIELYLRLADIDQAYLTDKEKILLGFLPQIKPSSPNELANLERLCYIYTETLGHLESKEAQIGVASSPPLLKLKIQEYRNTLQVVQKRIDDLTNKVETSNEIQTVRLHTAEVLEGKIVVGHMYGEELNTDIVQYSLYALASKNARSLMKQASIERFAVDDCIVLTNSEGFKGWNPSEIKTTVLSSHLPIPEDLEKLQQEKIAAIEKDYFNSSHYRLASLTPSFSDLGQLEVVLAPVGFHEYYSLTPFFDEPLLSAIDGSAVSIRQKYGNTALTYGSTDRGSNLIPSPISIQCIIVTADNQIVLMQRSSSVAFYPGHWSASFEETMNAPGLNRHGLPSRSDDADFFAGALRGLEEELAVTAEDVESMKVVSMNVEFLTLSMDVITTIRLNITGEEIRQRWLLEAGDRDEASRFDLLPADLPTVVEKLFSKTLWHPSARMRIIQLLFQEHGVKEVAQALKYTDKEKEQ